jgi:hypothetical protein
VFNALVVTAVIVGKSNHGSIVGKHKSRLNLRNRDL